MKRTATIVLLLVVATFAMTMLAVQNNSESLKRIRSHKVWGEQCEKKCHVAGGDLCGVISQGCCKDTYCTLGWKGYYCPKDSKVLVPGCTTD